MAHDPPKKREVAKPWAGMAGLLGAGLVTLVGVCRGLEPATILLRAFAAGVLLGGLASVVGALFSRIPRSS